MNPNATAVGGIYGYSHTTGGYDGGQAELVRVPFADVGPTIIPEWMSDEDALMCTDALPTGYFGAQLGDAADRIDVKEQAALALLRGRPDDPVTQTGILGERRYHGLSSRRRGHRVDTVHHPLDPVIVGLPWVAGGWAAWRLLRRARR